MKKKSKAKKIIKITALCLACLILVTVITAGFVLYGRIATVMSARQVGEELYTVNYQQNYHLDKALQAGIKNENDLFSFVCDEFYFGYRVDNNIKEYACSAFMTDTPEGGKLVGRNFDLGETEALSVYTHPSGGYASLATVDLDVMKVGSSGGMDPMSLEGKLAMLAAPYLSVDGVNEKGLSVSLLDLEYEKLHENSGRPALLILVAVRMLLDRAADVDEALELLSQYDIHSVERCTQHMFLADQSGKAVVVEWHRDEMKVVESPVCTNFRLSAKELNGDFSGQCERFDAITAKLSQHSENDAAGAMDILKAASVSWTQWSCVYDLDNFTVDYVIHNDFDHPYHLSVEDY